MQRFGGAPERRPEYASVTVTSFVSPRRLSSSISVRDEFVRHLRNVGAVHLIQDQEGLRCVVALRARSLPPWRTPGGTPRDHAVPDLGVTVLRREGFSLSTNSS